MQRYINDHGMDDMDGLIDYAYGLTTAYGEATGALACQMYDEIVKASGVNAPPAEMADTPSYDYTAKAIQGTLSNLNNTVPSTVGRLVKQTGADTTLKNALRDGAKFAWIPSGDTCAFCLALASRGWQYMSKKALKNGHAEHIHANCNCEYAISFDREPKVEGYDPRYYESIYDEAKGGNSTQKINYLRRERYAETRGRGAANAGRWSGSRLKDSLGADYEAFSSLVNESPMRGVYNQYSEEATYRRAKKGVYHPRSNEVEYALTRQDGMSPYSTLSHEVGHMVDHNMGRLDGLSFKEVDLINSRCIIGTGIRPALEVVPSQSDEFLGALRRDMEALKPKIADRSIRSELLADKVTSNATAGIQDALDGFYDTSKSGLTLWGHGSRYYNRKYSELNALGVEKGLKDALNEVGLDASSQAKVKAITRQYEAASEAWANIAEAVTVGGDQLRYVQEYMPEAYAAFMRIIGG